MIRVSVLGAGGRMGSAVIRALDSHPDFELAGALARHGSKRLGEDAGAMAGLRANGVLLSDDLATVLADADVAIDFTLPEATIFNISGCEAADCALVVGTTGHDDEQKARLKGHDWRVPAVLAPNMSVGVNLLYGLAAIAAKTLADYDVEISETHHRHKKDAPSGTALRLGEAVAQARGESLDKVGRFGRGPNDPPRSEGEIGISALRAGEVVGDHSVLLAGPGESLELRHSARDRASFANGALVVAGWVAGKPPALYEMSDVLGLGKALK